MVLVAETERVNGLLKNKALLAAERVIDQHEALLAAARVQQFKMDEECVLGFLTDVFLEKDVSKEIQDFAHRVLERCVALGTDDEYVLKWLRSDGQQYTTSRYKKMKGHCNLKTDAKQKSRKAWITDKARELMRLVGTSSKDHVGTILKVITDQSGYLIFEQGNLLLFIA